MTTGAGLGSGFRFSPHVLVLGLTFVAMFYAAQGAVVGFVHAWWGGSYGQVEFVMDEWRPNDGYPIIAGHLAESDEPAPFHLAGATVDGRRVMLDLPTVSFAPGTRVPVWYSPQAPLFSYNGESTNGVPVAALPTRPGWGQVASWGLATIAVASAGFAATAWVAGRFSRAG